MVVPEREKNQVKSALESALDGPGKWDAIRLLCDAVFVRTRETRDDNAVTTNLEKRLQNVDFRLGVRDEHKGGSRTLQPPTNMLSQLEESLRGLEEFR